MRRLASNKLLKRGVLLLFASALAATAFLAIQFGGDRSHSIPRPSALIAPSHTPASEYEWTSASTSSAQQWLAAIDHSLGELPPHASIIDLGCGDGSVLSHFRGRGWRLMGVDTSQSGIRMARDRWPDIHFEVADATEDLSAIGYQAFDAVISTDVIEHVFLPRKYAANCFRLLKPGGTLVIGTPYHGYFKNLAIALSGKWDSHVQPLHDYGHIRFWSLDTLSTLLFESGFEQLEWRGAGRFPFLWKDMIFRARTPEKPPSAVAR